MPSPPLILASASLSRRELLSHAGLSFDIEPSGVDETEVTRSLQAERASPQEIAEKLAEMKALRVSARHGTAMVVGGDSTLACNGRRVPLQPTGVQGEWIAGVRYKAWNPPATLHPTTAAVGALVFDLIDTWTRRAIGGCRFFPARPALTGPAAASPAALEPAEGERDRLPRLALSPLIWQRPRAGTFVPEGSGQGPMTPPPEEMVFGHVLDLTAPT